MDAGTFTFLPPSHKPEDPSILQVITIIDLRV